MCPALESLQVREGIKQPPNILGMASKLACGTWSEFSPEDFGGFEVLDRLGVAWFLLVAIVRDAVSWSTGRRS